MKKISTNFESVPSSDQDTEDIGDDGKLGNGLVASTHEWAAHDWDSTPVGGDTDDFDSLLSRHADSSI